MNPPRLSARQCHTAKRRRGSVTLPCQGSVGVALWAASPESGGSHPDSKRVCARGGCPRAQARPPQIMLCSVAVRQCTRLGFQPGRSHCQKEARQCDHRQSSVTLPLLAASTGSRIQDPADIFHCLVSHIRTGRTVCARGGARKPKLDLLKLCYALSRCGSVPALAPGPPCLGSYSTSLFLPLLPLNL